MTEDKPKIIRLDTDKNKDRPKDKTFTTFGELVQFFNKKNETDSE